MTSPAASGRCPTLEAYVARQGRTKETAAALGVHPNTVKYRLRELQEVAGALLADPERASALLLAVRLRRLLESEAQRSDTASDAGARADPA